MFTSAEHVGVARRLPGDLAMWFFILAELSVFALLILAFTVAQALHPQVFSEGHQEQPAEHVDAVLGHGSFSISRSLLPRRSR